MLRVLDIIPGTSVDGPGLRTSIYFAGCAHGCPGCHNPRSWDFNGGHPMSIDQIMAVITEEGFNVTLTGGDPMYQADKLLPLVRSIKAAGLTLWCYTGFLLQELRANPAMNALLDYIDVIVDGPFIESERDLSLPFRGSRNQRIIPLTQYR